MHPGGGSGLVLLLVVLPVSLHFSFSRDDQDKGQLDQGQDQDQVEALLCWMFQEDPLPDQDQEGQDVLIKIPAFILISVFELPSLCFCHCNVKQEAACQQTREEEHIPV